MHPQIRKVCEELRTRYVAIEPHRPSDVQRAEQSTEPSQRQGVEPARYSVGGRSSQYRYRILDRWAAHPSRCAGATAEKAVPFPDAVRRSELFLVRCAQPILRGDRSRVRCRRGNQRVVRLKPIRGAQDGLSTANATGRASGRARLACAQRRSTRLRPSRRARRISLPCGVRPISCRPLAKALCPRSAAAFLSALRCACGSSWPAPARRAPLARCDAAPPLN